MVCQPVRIVNAISLSCSYPVSFLHTRIKGILLTSCYKLTKLGFKHQVDVVYFDKT